MWDKSHKPLPETTKLPLDYLISPNQTLLSERIFTVLKVDFRFV